jgi:site-specific DNA recombinase
VEIHSYLDGRRITVAEDTDEVQSFMAAWSSSQERKKASQRTRDALRRKAAQGFVAGGRTYGYDNVRLGSHVQRRVNEAEAVTVRRIFGLVADGWGLRRIARRLTEEGVPTRTSQGWAATTLRAIVFRDLYRGIVTYGKSRTERRGGKERKVTVASGWITVEQPDLRIVDEALWQRAHARLDRTRESHPGYRRPNGQLLGRPESGLISQHLLTGHLRCGSCGGGMFFSPRTRPNGKVVKYWLCTNHHKLGSRACVNKWHLPYDTIADAVLGHFDRITPSVVEEMVADELARCLDGMKDLVGQRGVLEAERERIDGELSRLAEGVAHGGDVPELLAAMGSRRRQRAEILAKLEHLEGIGPDISQVLAGWRAQAATLALQSMTGLRAVLESGSEGRQMLRQILKTPIVITPEVEAGRLNGWNYEADAVLGPLIGHVEQESLNRLRIP